jgi:hypothetical protein
VLVQDCKSPAWRCSVCQCRWCCWQCWRRWKRVARSCRRHPWAGCRGRCVALEPTGEVRALGVSGLDDLKALTCSASIASRCFVARQTAPHNRRLASTRGCTCRRPRRWSRAATARPGTPP